MTRHGIKKLRVETSMSWLREPHVAYSADRAKNASMSTYPALGDAHRSLKIRRSWRNMSQTAVCQRDADQTEIVKSP